MNTPGTANVESPLQTTPFGTRRFRLYSIVVAGPMILGMAVAFMLARTEGYVKRSQSFWIAGLDYSFSLANVNADVVIFGDSSALAGVNPKVLEAKTGLSAVNVSTTMAGLAVAGTFPLDHYLAHNRVPRLIIFHFSPFEFRRPDWHDATYFEGMLMLVRHRPDHDTALLFLRHLPETFQFSEYVFTSWLKEAVIPREERYQGVMRSLTGTRGYLALPGSEMPGRSDCETYPTKPVSPAWIGGLREKYSRNGTTVIVYVSPMPDCEEPYKYYSRALVGVANNSLEKLPGDNFRPDGSNVHLTQAATTHNSEQIAEQILVTSNRYRGPVDSKLKIQKSCGRRLEDDCQQ
jgi:hypothetical protein